ncbi:MAG: serine/threonine protein kinase [Lachnospiraceae bacterium]|nr:serine/threonine protein kinase [Lachnospiraceae bacterium]
MLTAEGGLCVGFLLDDRYRILSLIGQGGQSRVYLAIHTRTGKKVAVKQLRRDIPDIDLARRSLRLELAILTQLKHPGIPEILDVIEESPGEPILVMEYIEGRTASKLLSDQGAQSQDDAVRWGVSLCDILSCLHEQKPPFVYRDLKPGNIILRADGRLSLIDFGAVAEADPVIRQTVSMGTPGYAAPEQFDGNGRIDVRTDIYCLGTTLYALLTGCQPPGHHKAPLSIRAQNPDLSVSLDAVIRKCTNPDPKGRYASCAEVSAALKRYRARDRMLRIRSATLHSAAAAACAAGIILAVTMGVLARRQIAAASESATAADAAENSSEQERYLELGLRIRENREALLEAGVSEEELQEILRYIEEQTAPQSTTIAHDPSGTDH